MKERDYRMINVPCPLCGGQEHREERTVKGFELVQCCGCTLVFMNPQLDSESLSKIYMEKKDPNELVELYARLATPRVLKRYDHKLEQIERLLGRRGRIMDFACAAGYLLERAAARGWDAHGVDIGPWVKLAGEKRGLRNIHIGQLAELNFPDGYFDVIYAGQVLEHLQAPLKMLSEFRRILSPTGLLYADVPNYHTLPIMLGKDDFYLNSPPQHINYFTPRTLSQLLESGGFKVEALETEGGLKWENLIGRPIISDIADAYRPPEQREKGQAGGGAGSLARLANGGLGTVARSLLYRHAKLGMNIAAFCRPIFNAA